MTSPRPDSRTDLRQIAARNETARRMLARFAAETQPLADVWQHLSTALTDALALAAEVTLLRAELAATRLDAANLLAAIRATLAANADGETDPLWYIRDELNARQPRSPGHGGMS